MNTKGNQRFLDTREKIQTVFQELMQKKELSKISVAEICREAGIHRTTFYGHYLDIPDLMDQMMREMYSDFMGVFLKNEDIHMKEGFLRMFAYIREHRDFFQNYLWLCRSRNRGEELLPDVLEQKLNDLILTFGYASKEELLYHQEFFVGGLLALISRWMDGGCKEEPEQIYQIIADEYGNARIWEKWL